jgi:hypothetical protein
MDRRCGWRNRRAGGQKAAKCNHWNAHEAKVP